MYKIYLHTMIVLSTYDDCFWYIPLSLIKNIKTLLSTFDRNFARFLYEFLALRMSWPSEDDNRGCYDVFRGHRIIKRQKFVQKSCETTIENNAVIRAQIGYVLFSIFDLPFAKSAVEPFIWESYVIIWHLAEH